MADKIRLFIQRLKDRVQIPRLSLIRDRIKVDQIIKNYSPTEKLNKIADQLKHDSLTQKVRDLMSKYEKFTGVEEIMAIQNTVIDAQEKFIGAQDRRRDLGKQLASIEARLKELHADMQNTMKGDEKYLQLCTEEHKLIIQERALRSLFSDAEREERELFATMSAAVKLGHERERAHAERNKYWYIVASIFGTVLGIAGSSINNHLKMAEFRDMMEQQMARSASVLYTIAGGESTGDVPRVDITKAMKTEFEYQEHLARNLKVMQDSIDHLVNKQTSLIENIHAQKEYFETSLRELKRVVVLASQSSAKSDAELAKALSVVHHDLDDAEHIRDKDRELPKNRIVLDSNQIITGMGIVMCVAMIIGSLMGKAS